MQAPLLAVNIALNKQRNDVIMNLPLTGGWQPTPVGKEKSEGAVQDQAHRLAWKSPRSLETATTTTEKGEDWDVSCKPTNWSASSADWKRKNGDEPTPIQRVIKGQASTYWKTTLKIERKRQNFTREPLSDIHASSWWMISWPSGRMRKMKFIIIKDVFSWCSN